MGDGRYESDNARGAAERVNTCVRVRVCVVLTSAMPFGIPNLSALRLNDTAPAQTGAQTGGFDDDDTSDEEEALASAEARAARRAAHASARVVDDDDTSDDEEDPLILPLPPSAERQQQRRPAGGPDDGGALEANFKLERQRSHGGWAWPQLTDKPARPLLFPKSWARKREEGEINEALVFGLLPAAYPPLPNQPSMNENGVFRQGRLPTRSQLLELFVKKPYGLAATCEFEAAKEKLELSLRDGSAVAYVLLETLPSSLQPEDPFELELIGAIALAPSRDEEGHGTRSPNEWIHQLVQLTNSGRFLEAVPGGAGRQTERGAYDTLQEMRYEGPTLGTGMTFYFDWVCTANSKTGSAALGEDPRFKGAGSLLVEGLAKYIDRVYVLPAVLPIAMETEVGQRLQFAADPTVQQVPDRSWSAQDIDEHNAQWRKAVLEWIRKRTFFECISITTARPFWEDQMGFRQISGVYSRKSAQIVARYVFPNWQDARARPPPPEQSMGATWENDGAPIAPGDREHDTFHMIRRGEIASERGRAEFRPGEIEEDDDDEGAKAVRASGSSDSDDDIPLAQRNVERNVELAQRRVVARFMLRKKNA